MPHISTIIVRICSPWATAAALLIVPTGVLAQIPSTTNAAQGSGNNSFGSSTTTFSTPSFESSSPEAISAFNQAVISSISDSPLLAAILDQLQSGGKLSALDEPSEDVSITDPSTTPPQQLSLTSLAGIAAALTQPGETGATLQLTKASTGATGTLTVGPGQILVLIEGQTLSLPTTQENALAMTQYAAVAVAAGFAPEAISLGAQLVSAGIAAGDALSLISSLQTLLVASQQPETFQAAIPSLQSGIEVFNRIVAAADSTVLSNLLSNSNLLSLRTALVSARDAYSAAFP